MQTRIVGGADDLAVLVPDGATVALAKDPGAPMALVAALVRRGVRDLHLVTVPTEGMAADVRIGAGRSVATATGFDVDRPARVPETPGPDAAGLALIRGPVAAAIGRIYPAFAGRVFSPGAGR